MSIQRIVTYTLIIALAIALLLWGAAEFGAWLGHEAAAPSFLLHHHRATTNGACPPWASKRHLCGGLW
jgi:hypothetical protein